MAASRRAGVVAEQDRIKALHNAKFRRPRDEREEREASRFKRTKSDDRGEEDEAETGEKPDPGAPPPVARNRVFLLGRALGLSAVAWGGPEVDLGTGVLGEDARSDICGTIFGIASAEPADAAARGEETRGERLPREDLKKLERQGAFLSKTADGLWAIYAKMADVIETRRSRSATIKELEAMVGRPVTSVMDGIELQNVYARKWEIRSVILADDWEDMKERVVICGWPMVQAALQERRRAIKIKRIPAKTPRAGVPGTKCRAFAKRFAQGDTASAGSTPASPAVTTAQQRQLDQIGSKVADLNQWVRKGGWGAATGEDSAGEPRVAKQRGRGDGAGGKGGRKGGKGGKGEEFQRKQKARYAAAAAMGFDGANVGAGGCLFCGDASDTRHNVSKCPVITDAVKHEFYDKFEELAEAAVAAA
jgi:hypothetical protein